VGDNKGKKGGEGLGSGWTERGGGRRRRRTRGERTEDHHITVGGGGRRGGWGVEGVNVSTSGRADGRGYEGGMGLGEEGWGVASTVVSSECKRLCAELPRRLLGGTGGPGWRGEVREVKSEGVDGSTVATSTRLHATEVTPSIEGKIDPIEQPSITCFTVLMRGCMRWL